MFFTQPKAYNIIFINKRFGTDIYCFEKYIREKNYVKIKDYYIYVNNKWTQVQGENIIDLREVIKWV